MGLSKERAARWSPRAGVVGETQPNQVDVGGACQEPPPTSLSVSLHLMTPPSSQSTLFLLVRDLPSHIPCAPQSLYLPQLHSPPPDPYRKRLGPGLTVGAVLWVEAPLQLPLPREAMP